METIISTIVIIACTYFFTRSKANRQKVVHNLRLLQIYSKKKSRMNLHTPRICA